MAKLSRYGPDILTELFDENSNVNRADQGLVNVVYAISRQTD